MTSYSNCGPAERQFLSKHFGQSLPKESFICKKHFIEAKRYNTNTEYTPKWKIIDTTTAQILSKKCINPDCANRFSDKLITPAFASVADLEKLLGVESSENTSLLLCPNCYTKLHRLYTTQNCSSCGTMPKPGSKLYRHSPDSILVSKYIKDTTGNDLKITPDDLICTSCYNSHCKIINSIKCEQIGSDEMLAKCIAEWEARKLAHNTDRLTSAILSSVLFVAKHLLPHKAVLLPWVCSVFLQAYGITHTGDIKSAQIVVEVGDGSVNFSSRWLLHQLIIYLDTFMAHKCMHMKFGTILYRKGADMLATLSWALSTSQLADKYWVEPDIQQQQPDAERTLTEASNIINKLIHDEIKRVFQTQTSSGFTSLNINEQFNNINPILLQFLSAITKSVREMSETNEHIKKIRLFFILSQLMFCTNPKKPTQFHDVIADITEVCGGSRQLIRILNRLGCCSSPDTHDRFVTEHAIARRQAKIYPEMFLLLPLLIILICCRVIQQSIAVINTAVIMALLCSWCSLIPAIQCFAPVLQTFPL